MFRWMGLTTFALWAGMVSASFGQMSGMSGGRSNLRNFGNAGADSPKGSQVCSVKMVSADGKTAMGNLRLTSAVVDCSFGIYEIKPDKVQEIRLDARSRNEQMAMNQTGMQRPGAIITTSGEEIDGVVLIPGWWRVETELGFLNPNSEGLKSITFVKKGEEGLRESPVQSEAIPTPARIVPAPASPERADPN